MKQFFFLAALILSLTLITACNKDDDNPSNSSNGLKEITIKHSGIDWSEGLSGGEVTDYNKIDGETIAWCPNGNGSGWSMGIWYRSSSDKIMKLNATDLNAVTSIDETQWSNDVCATPLTPGAVWAAKANDGYVVFKVLQVATDSASIANDPEWSARVQYKFSASTNF